MTTSTELPRTVKLFRPLSPLIVAFAILAIGDIGQCAGDDEMSGLLEQVALTDGGGTAFNAIASDGNGLWVAVGTGGGILSSIDGNNWKIGYKNNLLEFESIAYGDKNWVAVGTGGAIFTSPNGKDWEQRQIGVNINFLRVMYANEHWVAAGTSGAIFISLDGGITWAERYSDDDISLNALAQSDDLWVAAGDRGVILTSRDGEKWNAVNNKKNIKFTSVASGRGRWVAIGYDYILTSPDGKNWKISYNKENCFLSSVAYGGMRWVAVGSSGMILISANGENWEQVPNISADIFFNHVMFNGNRWIAVGSEGSIYTSINGENWESTRDQAAISLNSVEYSSGLWISVGYEEYEEDFKGLLANIPRSAILVSLDGKRWERTRDLNSVKFNSIIHKNGTWIAVGSEGSIFTSLSGEAWRRVRDNDNIKFYSIEYGDAHWIAVGSEGAIVTSSDGEKWERRTYYSHSSLYSIEFGNNNWVAVGSEGAIYTSTDGLVWQHEIFEGNTSLTSVAYGEGRWVIAGDNGTILTSTDGIGWERVRIQDTITFFSVLHSNGRWVVTGSDGTVLTSTNGENWKTVRERDYLSLFSVAYNDGRWVAVGTEVFSDYYGEAAILTSSDSEKWDALKVDKTLYSVAVTDLGWIACGDICFTSASSRQWSQPLARLEPGDGDATDRSIIVVQDGRLILLRPSVNAPMIRSVKPTFDAAESSFEIEVYSGDEKFRNLTGEVQLLAQTLHNFNHEGLGLKPVGSAQKIDLGLDLVIIEIGANLSESIGVVSGSPFVFAVTLSIGSSSVFYPEHGEPARTTYKTASASTWISALSIILTIWFSGLVAIVAIWIMNPVQILRLRALADWFPFEGIRISGIAFPVSDLLHVFNFGLLPRLAKTDRVLTAWVKSRATSWKEKGFESEPTVQRSSGYVSLPCRWDAQQDGELIDRPGPDLIARLWGSKHPWTEIVGVGGAGKTMLSIQICRWVLAEESGKQRLPVLIEEDTDNLLATVRRKLQAALGELDEVLIRNLVEKGKVLVVFDRLSERSSETIKYVRKLRGTLRLGAGLVSTRRQLDYEGGGIRRIYPMSLDSAQLMLFLGALLRQRGEDAPLLVKDQSKLLDRLGEVIQGDGRELALTPLLVRLFLKRAIELLKLGQGLESLPTSVPDIYFRYIESLNPDDPLVPNRMSNKDMLRAARILAVLSVSRNFVPQDFSTEKASDQLVAAGWKDPNLVDPIERLKSNGVIVERADGARYKLVFALDPVAEYLAADELLEEASDEVARQDLFRRVREGGEAAEGFLQALEITRSTRQRTSS